MNCKEIIIFLVLSYQPKKNSLLVCGDSGTCVMMPKIDGYTVCEMIRQESNVPIIMLTALDEEEAQVKAFELKVDD